MDGPTVAWPHALVRLALPFSTCPSCVTVITSHPQPRHPYHSFLSSTPNDYSILASTFFLDDYYNASPTWCQTATAEATEAGAS
jgi:hypothetical protein